MKKILKRTVQLILCLLVIAPADVQAATSNGNGVDGLGGYILLGAFALGLCGYSLITGVRKFSLERKLSTLYKALSAEEQKEIFKDGEKYFYFVGTMLKKVLPKADVREVLSNYIELYRVYINLEEDVYQSFDYAKTHFCDYEEDELYALLAVVMVCAGGVSEYGNCSVERIVPAKRKAKSKVKSVETIANQDESSSVQSEMELGTKENAILVAGTIGIKDYLNSMTAEDGTSLSYEHLGTVYVKDNELEIEYDLRKYVLKDAETDGIICDLWFNPYGMENSKQCIPGFVLRKDVHSDVDLATDTDKSTEVQRLSVPEGVDVENIAATGKPMITWTPVDGADKYFVYRATSRSEIFTYQGASVATEYVDLRAKAGIRYNYKVKAANSANQFVTSELSNLCYVVCDLPAPIVTAGNDEETGYVQLTWEPVAGAVRYEIYRSTSADGEYRKMNSQRVTRYVNLALVEPGVMYYYKVRAIHSNIYGSSADSEIVTGMWNPEE